MMRRPLVAALAGAAALLVASPLHEAAAQAISAPGALINDAVTSTAAAWSSDKINSSLAAVMPVPQGRLTLVSGTPDMTSDQVNAGTLYYPCYRGKAVPYFDGAVDRIDSIPGCQVSDAMQASGAGVLNSGQVFDIAWDPTNHNICVVTDGSGHGWAGDTGGSNTARGSGYSAVHNVRGYNTFSGTTAHCYNAGTDYGSAAADLRVYLGSLYTTAAGKTTMQFTPAPAAGGSNAFLALFNAYQQRRIASRSMDSTANWTYGVMTTWRAANNSAANRVTYLDGLASSQVTGTYEVLSQYGTIVAAVGMTRDSITASPLVYSQGGGGTSTTLQVALNVRDVFSPLVGLHYIQAMEGNVSANTNVEFWGSSVFQSLQVGLDM